jgi:hypothetical protein
LQPDIPEEDALDNMALEVVKLDHNKSDHASTEIPYRREKKEKLLGWLWVRGFSSRQDNVLSLFF